MTKNDNDGAEYIIIKTQNNINMYIDINDIGTMQVGQRVVIGDSEDEYNICLITWKDQTLLPWECFINVKTQNIINKHLTK